MRIELNTNIPFTIYVHVPHVSAAVRCVIIDGHLRCRLWSLRVMAARCARSARRNELEWCKRRSGTKEEGDMAEPSWWFVMVTPSDGIHTRTSMYINQNLTWRDDATTHSQTYILVAREWRDSEQRYAEDRWKLNADHWLWCGPLQVHSSRSIWWVVARQPRDDRVPTSRSSSYRWLS